MFKIRHWIKDFFGFSRSQVNGFIILLTLTTLFLFSEPLWHWWVSTRTPDSLSDRAILDSLVASWNQAKMETKGQQVSDTQQVVLSPFDPNTSTTKDLISLGFSQSLAVRLTRYREKGGEFRIKSDLRKIYGLDSTFYDQIYPFILLPERKAFSEKVWRKPEPKNVLAPKKISVKFDLNNADTSQLKKIYGIGDKLSLRILKYRDVLGGFVDMHQLKEVYGLDSLVIHRLFENSTIQRDFQPTKININTASEKQLSSHPYLSKVAKAIVSYRFQHGDFKAVDEIRNVGVLDETSVQRVVPYLKVNE